MYRVDRDGDRGDHDRGDKSHFNGLLKNFFAEDSHDGGSTSGVSGGSGGLTMEYRAQSLAQGYQSLR
jgi:hypothetical protein